MRVTNEQLLEEIKKAQGNGEIRQLKTLLPRLEVVASLADDVPALKEIATYRRPLVEDAQKERDREGACRTLDRWFGFRWPWKPVQWMVAAVISGVYAALGFSIFNLVH